MEPFGPVIAALRGEVADMAARGPWTLDRDKVARRIERIVDRLEIAGNASLRFLDLFGAFASRVVFAELNAAECDHLCDLCTHFARDVLGYRGE